MNYVISDIHGCYDKYEALLNKINFSPDDKLYFLGDAIDLWFRNGGEIPNPRIVPRR